MGKGRKAEKEIKSKLYLLKKSFYGKEERRKEPKPQIPANIPALFLSFSIHIKTPLFLSPDLIFYERFTRQFSLSFPK